MTAVIVDVFAQRCAGRSGILHEPGIAGNLGAEAENCIQNLRSHVSRHQHDKEAACAQPGACKLRSFD